MFFSIIGGGVWRSVAPLDPQEIACLFGVMLPYESCVGKQRYCLYVFQAVMRHDESPLPTVFVRLRCKEICVSLLLMERLPEARPPPRLQRTIRVTFNKSGGNIWLFFLFFNSQICFCVDRLMVSLWCGCGQVAGNICLLMLSEAESC